ncbi:Transmembrane protein 43 homolog [Gryllus bimaculatus]|nr:Transmembrane protein 43 homolog [Gryllus bimaculatus]
MLYQRNISGLPYAGIQHSRHPFNIRAQIKANWCSLLIGCFMFVLGMSLLFWNEGRAIHSTRSLEEAMNTVISLPFALSPKEENNGHLVHLTGPLSVAEPLTEVEYGIVVSAVRLKRRVQMYQWVEEEIQSREYEQNEYPFARYTYTTEYRDKLIDSNKFYQRAGHHNPTEFPLKSIIYVSEEVNVGYFALGPELKAKFNNFILVTSDERPERRDIKMHSGLYYHCQDVWTPEVGDIRVQFSYAGKAGEVVTVVGMQVGSTIRPYKTSSGKEVLILCDGAMSVEEIFLQEHAQNLWTTWIFRGLVGRYSMLHEVLILGFGSVSVAVSLSGALLIFAFAWIWYRPFFGFVVASVAVLPIVYGSLKLYIQDYYDNNYRRLHTH